MANVNFQTLFDQASIADAFPSANQSALDDYLAKTQIITQLLNEAAPKSGSGSPEGSVASGLSQLYVDTDVNQLYWNPAYNVNTGWVAL